MPRLILQQVSSKYARANRGKTLDKPVALKFVEKYLVTSDFEKLRYNFPEGYAYFWGAKYERGHQIRNMIGALVLFRQSKTIFRISQVAELFLSERLSDFLWGRDDSDEAWGIVYAMTKTRDVNVPASDINKVIGRKASDNWQGMTAIDGGEAQAAVDFLKVELGVA